MRFGQFNGNSQNGTEQNGPVKGWIKMSKVKTLLKVLLLILAVLLIVWGGYYFWQTKSNSVGNDPAASEYYAVFLNSGQVYFGKQLEKNRDEFVLYDVYYLQVSDNTAATAQEQLTEPKFSLVKLGQELHGPTDRLYINLYSVLFYEQLKNDSKVVESIKNKK